MAFKPRLSGRWQTKREHVLSHEPHEPREPLPWTLGQIRHDPCGLREAVLRIGHLTLHHREVLARGKSNTLYHLAARWSFGDQALWAELVRLVTTPDAPTPPPAL